MPAPQRAPNVVASTLEAALDWLPDRLREPAAEYAHSFDGYPLLTLLLGYDPLAHRRVTRTPEALAKGLLRFSEQGTQLYEAVQKSGALPQAGQLIQREAARYHLDGARLLGLLRELARRYDKYHLYQMVTNPDLLLHPLGALAADVWAFAKAVAPPLLELVLRALGPRGQQVLDLLHRGQTTFALIMANPRGFVVNLVEGVRLGFSQFAHNALRHLGNAFTTWLFGDVEGGLRLELPITGAGLFQFGLSVLNLGYAQLRQKLVKRLGARGEQVVGILEKAASLVHTLVTEGPAAAGRELLGMARTALDGLKQQVLDGLREWLMQTLLMKGVQKLAMLLSPASALLETLLQTYNTVVFFIERAERFRDLLTTIVGAVSDIATGVLAPAANKVENTLARGLSLALDWLMRLVGLGNVPAKVREHIEHARHWVDELVDKYLDKFIEMAKKLWQKGKQAAAGAVGAVKGWLGLSEEFTVGQEVHHVFVADEQGKPALMVASVPVGYQGFLDESKKHFTDKSMPIPGTVLQAIAQIEKLGRDIDKELQKGTGQPATSTPATQAASTAQAAPDTAKIEKLLGKIARHCFTVMEAMVPATGLAEEATPVYSGETGAGFSTGMHMPYIASHTTKDKDGEIVLRSIGTEPESSAKNDKYDNELNPRGTDSYSNYYIRGHLLNHNLHGKGQWVNMTPLSVKGNKNHLLGIETFLKDLAMKDALQKDATGKTPAYGFYYSVVPEYGRPLRSDLLTQASGMTDIDGLSYAQFVTLVHAEVEVPLRLICTWERVEGGTGKRLGGGRTITIDNPVEQRAVTDYHGRKKGVKKPSYSLNRKGDATPVGDMLAQHGVSPDMVQLVKDAMEDKEVFFRSTSVGTIITRRINEEAAQQNEVPNATLLAEAKLLSDQVKQLVEDESLNFGKAKSSTP